MPNYSRITLNFLQMIKILAKLFWHNRCVPTHMDVCIYIP